MKYAWLLLLLLVGCHDVKPKPPVPPPVVVVPPVPPPLPPSVPVPPPDTIRLDIFPSHRDLAPGEQGLFCVAWRFPNGHVVLRRHDYYRSISDAGRTCLSEYQARFTLVERTVTAAEQDAADSRSGEVWRSGDTTVVRVESFGGGVLPREQFVTRWVQWSQKRTPSPNEHAVVYLQWRGQLVTAHVLVRSQGWFVSPE